MWGDEGPKQPSQTVQNDVEVAVPLAQRIRWPPGMMTPRPAARRMLCRWTKDETSGPRRQNFTSRLRHKMPQVLIRMPRQISPGILPRDWTCLKSSVVPWRPPGVSTLALPGLNAWSPKKQKGDGIFPRDPRAHVVRGRPQGGSGRNSGKSAS